MNAGQELKVGMFVSWQLIIQDGNHPAYLDDPELWNAELVKFALDVAKAKGGS